MFQPREGAGHAPQRPWLGRRAAPSRRGRWRTPAVEALEDRTVPALLPPVSYGGIGQTTWAVTSGDFNGDGALDLVTADTIGHGVSVLLNNGDGSFQTPRSLDAGYGPYSLAVGDFNGDGALDLAVANADIERFYLEDVEVPPGGPPYSVSVLLGNGDGTFRPRTAYGLGFEPGNVHAADLNGDGLIDLAVAAARGPKVSVLLSGGDAFSTPAVYSLPSAHFIYGMDLGDVNGDGALDLVATAIPTSVSGSRLYVLLGQGDGGFQAPLTSSVARAYGLSLVDFDGDGALDVLLESGGSSRRVQRGNGDGTFAAPVTLTTPVGTVDFNGDGVLDAVGLQYPGTLRVQLGNGDGTFRGALELSLGPDAGSLLVGDFNGDGLPDLVVGHEWLARVTVLLNDGAW